MADEYIKRILAKAEFTGNFRDEYPTALIHALIDSVPTADVAPVRHGRWENINDLECFKCSCCGEYANQPWGKDGAIMFSYCPNCGCKMDGGDTSERQTMAFQSQND